MILLGEHQNDARLAIEWLAPMRGDIRQLRVFAIALEDASDGRFYVRRIKLRSP